MAGGAEIVDGLFKFVEVGSLAFFSFRLAVLGLMPFLADQGCVFQSIALPKRPFFIEDQSRFSHY